MNPEDIQHTLDRHENDLDRIADDVEKLKALRESIEEIASALRLLPEIYTLKIGALSSPASARFNSLLDSAIEKVRQSARFP